MHRGALQICGPNSKPINRPELTQLVILSVASGARIAVEPPAIVQGKAAGEIYENGERDPSGARRRDRPHPRDEGYNPPSMR